MTIKKTQYVKLTYVSYCPDAEMEFSVNEPDLPSEERLILQNDQEKMTKPFLSTGTSTCSDDSTSTDPAYYANKNLSPELINQALKLESQNLNSMDFPSSCGRKFNPKVKKILLPNGTIKERKWLVYSKHSDESFACIVSYFLYKQK